MWLDPKTGLVVQGEKSPFVTKYIRVDNPLFAFQTKEEYVLAMHNVVFDENENPILQSPNGQKKPMVVDEKFRAAPVEIKGDWLKIGLVDNNLVDAEQDLKEKANYINSGWIRWRKDESLIIHDYYP